jgi:iron complex transport system permease protein
VSTPTLPRAGLVAPPRPVRLRGVVVRSRWVSLRIDRRSVLVSLILVVAIVLVGCWSIGVGDYPISIRNVVRTLLGGGTDETQFIVETLRLPRLVCGLLVGAAFGVAGAIFQSLARNPLGSPDVIGFDTGAALGAVMVIVALESSGAVHVALGAVGGGLLTALIVYVFAWKRGVQTYRLVLVGIGVGFAAASVADYLLTRAQISEVQRATVWLTGSLNGRGWEHVGPVSVGLLVLVPLTLMLCRSMRLLELGDDKAAALGVRVGRTRLWLVLVGVGLAALATAAAGPIAFVALVSPPIARRLVRSPGATIVPAALLGALLTIGADLLARRALAPTELPVGVATAVIGAPYLLWLLTREIRTGEL